MDIEQLTVYLSRGSQVVASNLSVWVWKPASAGGARYGSFVAPPSAQVSIGDKLQLQATEGRTCEIEVVAIQGDPPQRWVQFSVPLDF